MTDKTDQGNQGVRITRLTVVTLILAFGAYLTTPIYHPQIFGDLTIGRWINAHASLPRVDLWTLAGRGHSWQTDSWLFQVVVSWLEAAWGFKGLLFFKLFSICCALLVAACVFIRRSQSYFVGTLLTFLAGGGALLLSPLNATLWGLIFFLLSLEVLQLFRESFFKLRSFCLLLCVLAIYGNIHISYFGVLVTSIISLSIAGRTNWRKTSLSAFALLATASFTPYLGTQILGALGRIANNVMVVLSLQLQAPTVYNYPFAVLIIMSVMLALFIHWRPGLIHGEELTLVLALAAGGFVYLPAVSFSVLALGFGLAVIWGRSASSTGDARSKLGNMTTAIEKLADVLSKLPALGVIWISLCFIIIFVYQLELRPVDLSGLPVAPLDYIENKALPNPLLHSREIGSYLVYRFSDKEDGVPRKRVALDSRALALDPVFAVGSIAWERLAPGWRKFFVGLNPKTVLCLNSEPIYQLLRRDAAWRLVYEAGRLREEANELSEIEQTETFRPGWAIFILVSSD